MLALVDLSRVMAKSSRKIYGQRFKSLLPMWDNARHIRKDLRAFARRVRGVLNFELETPPRPGEVGVCQAIIMLCISFSTKRKYIISRF
jgi:hypothetical protein